MNLKMRAHMMALIAAGMSLGNEGLDLSPEDFQGQTKRASERHKENLKAKGVQEFTIDGITVMARNRKNAIRKVKNIQNSLTHWNDGKPHNVRTGNSDG